MGASCDWFVLLTLSSFTVFPTIVINVIEVANYVSTRHHKWDKEVLKLAHVYELECLPRVFFPKTALLVGPRTPYSCNVGVT